MREAMDNFQPGKSTDFAQVQAGLGEVSAGAAALYRGEDSVALAKLSKAAKRRRGRRPT
jgi:hypothetical protein